ncbi:MAG: hypothetical protein ACLRWQ_20715 [Flavonifractor plautii]
MANNGIAAGLMKEEFFGPVVLMVIATTILTPVLPQAGLPRQRARLQRSAGERGWSTPTGAPPPSTWPPRLCWRITRT